MDQPYSRIADALLDRQYWSPDDPQKNPYDDTGWSFPPLFDTEAVRITDRQVLSATMSRVEEAGKPAGKVEGDGPVFVVAQRGDDSMISLRYALEDATVEAANEPFKAGGHDYPKGTWLVKGLEKEGLDAFRRTVAEAGLSVESMAAAPKVATRPVGKPRIALLHT